MRDENSVQAFETYARLKNLTLGSLAAINEKTIFIVFDDN